MQRVSVAEATNSYMCVYSRWAGAAWLGQKYPRSGWGGHCDIYGNRSCLFMNNDKNYMCVCILYHVNSQIYSWGFLFFGRIRLAEIKYSVYYCVIFFFPKEIIVIPNVPC